MFARESLHTLHIQNGCIFIFSKIRGDSCEKSGEAKRRGKRIAWYVITGLPEVSVKKRQRREGREMKRNEGGKGEIIP